MIDQKKIKEAESNVRMYLQDNMLKKEINHTAKQMYKENADLSLKTAQKLLSLEDKDYKPYLWIIVCSYYAMYYIANAVLLELGYKIGDKVSHKVTEDALIVFVRNKLKKNFLEDYKEVKDDALEIIQTKVDTLLKSFEYERGKRSMFQYEMSEEIKKEKALTSLDRAKTFIFEMGKLLK